MVLIGEPFRKRDPLVILGVLPIPFDRHLEHLRLAPIQLLRSDAFTKHFTFHGFIYKQHEMVPQQMVLQGHVEIRLRAPE